MRGRRFTSLRARLLMLVFFALLPAVGVSLYSAFEQRRVAAIGAEQDALRIVRLAAGSQERLIEGARQLLLTLAYLPELKWGEAEECNAFLSKLLKGHRMYANFAVADRKGMTFASAIPIGQPVYVGDRAWFKRVMETKDFSAGDFQIGRITKIATLNFAYPILDEQGQIDRVVFASLDLAWMNQLATEANLPPDAAITLFDPKGVVLARYPDRENFTGRTFSEMPLLRKILERGAEGTAKLPGLDGVLRLNAFTPLRGAYVNVGIPESVAFASAHRMMVRNLVVLGTVVAFSLAAAWIIGNVFFMARVRELLRATKQLSVGDLRARTTLDYSEGELGELAHSFDEMAETLERRSEERERALTALRESERRFRDLFEFSPDAVFVEDFSGNVLDVNVAGCELHGMKREEIIGKNVSDLVPAELQKEIADVFSQWASGTLQTLRSRSWRSDGTSVPVEIRASRIDYAGRPALLFHVRDITESKQAEEALRQAHEELRHAHDDLDQRVKERTAALAAANAALIASQRRFDLVMRGTNDGIWDWDVGTGEVYFSPRWKSMIGYGELEIEGRFEEWEKRLHPDDREHALETLNAYMEGKSATYELEHRLQCKDGSYRWILARGVLLRDEAGHPFRMAGSHLDLTERKRAEVELKKYADEVSDLYNNAPCGYHSIDKDDVFVQMNDTELAWLGYSREEIVGKKKFGDLLTPESLILHRERFAKFKEDGLVHDIEYEMVRKDGTIIPVLLSAIALKDADGKFLMTRSSVFDITERRRAERQLDRFFALSLNLFCVAGFDGFFKRLNPAWEKVIGYTCEELLARPYMEFIHPDDREATLGAASHVASGEPLFSFENRYLCKDGSHRWLLWQAAPSTSEQLIYAVALDITERKLGEERTRELQSFLTSIVENIPLMLFVKDAKELRFVRVNKEEETLLGHKRADVLGKTDFDLFPREEAEFFTKKDREVLASGELLDIPAEPVLTTQGIRIFHTKKIPIMDAQGRPEYLLGISEDITERKRAEQRLQVQHDITRILSEAATREAATPEILRAVCETLGWDIGVAWSRDLRTHLLRSREIWLGGHGKFPVFVPATRKIRLADNVGLPGRVWASGQPEWIADASGHGDYSRAAEAAKDGLRAAVAFPVCSGGEVLLVIEVLSQEARSPDPAMLEMFTAIGSQIGQFIERKTAEDELAKASEDLLRSNHELELFAYVASHDLQEPLRMVASYTQLLQRRYQGKLDATADEFIHFAVDGAKRMQAFISDLLQYSRVGTRGKTFAPVDLNEVARRIQANLKMAIEESGTQLAIDPLPTLAGDDLQLTQLFQNLVSNAIKFRNKDQPPSIQISARQEGEHWQFSVADNGIGIAPEYFEKIFVIFQRLHTREEFSGTGIGLALCKRIVERHGGRIWVESEPGRGTVFYFTIPAKEAATDDETTG